MAADCLLIGGQRWIVDHTVVSLVCGLTPAKCKLGDAVCVWVCMGGRQLAHSPVHLSSCRGSFPHTQMMVMVRELMTAAHTETVSLDLETPLRDIARL